MNVRRGQAGNDVIAVQTILKNLGWSHLNVDGAFGPITEQAVIDFQWLSGLNTTGQVDDTTWAEMQTQYGQVIVNGGTVFTQPTYNPPTNIPVPQVPDGGGTQVPIPGGQIPGGGVVVPGMDKTMMIGIGLAALTLLMVARKNRMI